MTPALSNPLVLFLATVMALFVGHLFRRWRDTLRISELTLELTKAQEEAHEVQNAFDQQLIEVRSLRRQLATANARLDLLDGAKRAAAPGHVLSRKPAPAPAPIATTAPSTPAADPFPPSYSLLAMDSHHARSGTRAFNADSPASSSWDSNSSGSSDSGSSSSSSSD